MSGSGRLAHESEEPLYPFSDRTRLYRHESLEEKHLEAGDGGYANGSSSTSSRIQSQNRASDRLIGRALGRVR